MTLRTMNVCIVRVKNTLTGQSNKRNDNKFPRQPFFTSNKASCSRHVNGWNSPAIDEDVFGRPAGSWLALI